MNDTILFPAAIKRRYHTAYFTLATTWLAVACGLLAKSMEGASIFSYPLMFLPFISSAFVPTETMPAPVR